MTMAATVLRKRVACCCFILSILCCIRHKFYLARRTQSSVDIWRRLRKTEHWDVVELTLRQSTLTPFLIQVNILAMSNFYC